MSASPIETVLRGVRAVLLGNGASKLALIAFEFLIAGLMGASFFGIYSIALSVAQILAYLCLAGLHFGAVQYISKYEGETPKVRAVIFYALAVCGCFSLALAMLLAQIAPLAAEKFFSKPELASALLYAAPIVFFDCVNQIISSIYRGLREFRNSLLCYDLLRNVFCLVGLGGLCVAGVTLERVLMLCAGGGALTLVFGLWGLWRRGLLSASFPQDRALARELFVFSRPLFLWNLLVIFVVRPYVVAGAFLSSAETGVFALASKLALGFIFFQTAVNSGAQTEFAKFHHQKDMKGQQDLYQAVSQGLLAVVAVPGLCLFVNPDFVFGLVGHEYAAYGWLLLPTLLGHFLNAATGPAGHLLITNDRSASIVRLTLLDMFLLFGIFVPLTSVFGLPGAVAGETLRLVVYVFARLWVVKRDLGIHFFGRSYIKIAGAFSAACALGIALTLSGVSYIPAAAAALLAYGAVGLYIFLRDPQMQQELKILLRMS